MADHDSIYREVLGDADASTVGRVKTVAGFIYSISTATDITRSGGDGRAPEGSDDLRNDPFGAAGRQDIEDQVVSGKACDGMLQTTRSRAFVHDLGGNLVGKGCELVLEMAGDGIADRPGEIVGYFLTGGPGEEDVATPSTIPHERPESAALYDDIAAPCLTRETPIRADTGSRRVETLRPGVRIVTLNRGEHPIRRVGSGKKAGANPEARPKPRPTHISAGVSGNGLAGRDLLASRQHRKMVASHIAASLPGTHECPVAASKLAGRPGVFVDETVDEVKYFHLMLDRQAIRFAEDALTENLGLDQKARETIPPESREEETLPLFPAMADQDIPMTRTRPIPGSPQQKRLVAELAAAAQHPARARNAAHAKNNPMSSPDGKQDTRQATPPCPESRPQHGGDEFARSNQGTPPTDDGPHHPTGNCGPASDRFRHLRKPGPSRPAYPSDERHAEKYTNRHILFLANPACVSPHRHRTPCGRKPDTLALNTKASFRCTASDLRVQSVRKDVPGPSSANTKQP